MKGVRKIATTGIWKIEKRLDNVIDYTTNIEKTINSDYGKDSYYDLHNVIDYVEADYKTEKQFYVSGVNCNPKTALEEMAITKEQYGKTGGILGFHAFQSFAEGEVTPEQCHAIGVRLAEEMWGDRFEVVVSTHLNTNHYHNHFVINSVSFKDGKRYYDKRETYAELRRLSDSLCEEYGLSVLKEKPCRNSRINFANYQKDNNNKVNYYSIAKNDLDRAKGEYILFVDSDDYIESNTVEVLISEMKKDNLDIVAGNAVLEADGEDKKYLDITKHDKNKVTNGLEYYVSSNEADFFQASVWIYMYKRELILENNLFFEKGILHEDEEWTPRVMINAKRVKYINFIFYHYTASRENSIMNSKDKTKNMVDLFNTYKKLEKIFNETEASREQHKEMNDYLCRVYINACVLEPVNQKVYKENVDYKFILRNAKKTKTKIKLLIFLISKKLYRKLKSMY